MMKTLTTLTVATVFALSIAACASSPESDPAYISPNHYNSFNCNQISAEMQRVTAKLEQAEETEMAKTVLNSAVNIFAISQGYGVDNEDDVTAKRLRNQYDVLEQTAIRKECST